MEVKQPDRVLNSWHFFLKLKLSKGFFQYTFPNAFFPPSAGKFSFFKEQNNGVIVQWFAEGVLFLLKCLPYPQGIFHYVILHNFRAKHKLLLQNALLPITKVIPTHLLQKKDSTDGL